MYVLVYSILLFLKISNYSSNSFFQWMKIICNNIVYKISIYIEIAVGYMIPHSGNISPRYFRTNYA